MDCSLPSSSVHWLLQARTLEQQYFLPRMNRPSCSCLHDFLEKDWCNSCLYPSIGKNFFFSLWLFSGIFLYLWFLQFDSDVAQGSLLAFILLDVLWAPWICDLVTDVNLGVGDGQGGLACCDSWGCKESDTTERLIWSDCFKYFFCSFLCFFSFCIPLCISYTFYSCHMSPQIICFTLFSVFIHFAFCFIRIQLISPIV